MPIAFDWAMLALPWLGTNLTLLPILALFSIWLWRYRGRGDLALHLMIVVLGSLLMNAALKAVFDRPRPDLWPHRGQYKWAAYPSGHAIVGVAVFFTITIMLHRERGWRWPSLVASVLLLVSLYSRLYLGVHWPSDVMGGLLMGIVWLGVTQYAFMPFWAARSTGEAARGPLPRASQAVPPSAESRAGGSSQEPEQDDRHSGNRMALE